MTAKRKRECPRTRNPAKHGIVKKNWQKFCFHHGVLHRKVEGEKPQLVLPAKYIPKVCKALHHDMGHRGYEKTLSLIRSRFFSPGMSKDVKSWVHHCGRCLRFKGKTRHSSSGRNSNIRTIRTSMCRLSQGGPKWHAVYSGHHGSFY